jgi:uncharacterized circularly permuted ATP-grasp superfamily protein
MVSEPGTPYEEDRDAAGEPRPAYAALLRALDDIDLGELVDAVRGHLDEHGVTFGGQPFVVDPIPRLIPADEWEALAAGLRQRARALNAFLTDAYGEQRIVSAGVVDAETIEDAEGYEPQLAGRIPAGAAPAAIIGFDLVRAPDGRFLVLEDNLRTPSGIAYLVAAREAVRTSLPPGVPEPRPVAPAILELLGDTLRAAVPDAAPEHPTIVLVTDGPDNVAFYEHRTLAGALGIPALAQDRLHRAGDRLRAQLDDGREAEVDVVYRRTDVDQAYESDGTPTAIGELLCEPWLAGTLGLVNHFGNGVADDKLVHGHVEDFIGFYLNEEPLVRSVPTTSLADPAAVDDASRRLRELVIKPRHGHGGEGVTIGALASAQDLKGARETLRAHPERYICQPLVPLSRHPTVIDGRLQPRHVDLRPFCFVGSEPRLAPGALSRVSFDEDEMVVNSSRNGGGKDTWIVPSL